MRRIILIASIAFLSLAGCGTAPEPRKPTSPAPAAGRGSANWERPQAQLCLAQLGQSGAQFAPLPDRMDGGGCAALDSVKLDRVGGDMGPLKVTNLGPLACPLANSFAAWARYGVDRAARQILGSPVMTIETMGSYSCRNVAGTTRRSAHSRAEAIDIGAFVLADGRRISVKSGGMQAARSGSFCGRYTAVPARDSVRSWAPTTMPPTRTIFISNMATAASAGRTG